MARDDEIRKVAEDLRALARSLARDLRDAAEGGHRFGPPQAGVQPGAPPGGHTGDDPWTHQWRSRRRGRAWAGPYWWPGQWGWSHRGWSHRGWGMDPGYRRSASSSARGDGETDRLAGARRRSGAEPWADKAAWSGHGRRRSCRMPPVRRRWDSPAALALLAVVVGAAWILGILGAVSVPLEGSLAAGLVVLGLVIVVTARTDWSLSRRGWPMLAGAALLLVLISASSGLGVGPALRHVSFGTVHAGATPGATVYGGFGTLDVDATALPAGASLDVESVAGRTTVLTAPGQPVELHARVLAGQICLFGSSVASGAVAQYNGVQEPDSEPARTPIVLTIRQVAGSVTVGGGCG